MSKPLTIGQVAHATGLSTHTLRYYESAGLLHATARSEAGHRLYSTSDLDWLHFIIRLKATGMPITQMQAFAALRAQGSSSYEARREMLAVHQDAVLQRIAEQQANLVAITDKMAWYEAEVQREAHRHDKTLLLQRSEGSSSWTNNTSPPFPTRTATPKAGKS